MRFLLVFYWIASALFASNPSILQEFPTSSDQVVEMASSRLQTFEKQFSSFLQSSSKKPFSEIITEWNEIIYPLFSTGVIFTHLPFITADQKVCEKGAEETALLQRKIALSMNHPKLTSLFMDFVQDPQKQRALTPYERYSLFHILQSLPSETKEKLSIYPIQPFLYTQGSLPEKSLPSDHRITFLSWNICFLDYGLSMLFGGVLPWQSRIENIIEKIMQIDPDILCLQEVFACNANLVLVERLKTNYAHIYYKIGPNPAGLSIQSIGIPSGLFIASKYPLREETFTPYTKEQTPTYRAYGFFSAEIYTADRCIGKFITTHLQPGKEETDKQYRKKQIDMISHALSKKDIPIFLCGDFNIQKDSKEAVTTFSSYLSSQYTGLEWTCCELRDFWWKSKQNIHTFRAGIPEKEWLDYFFSIKQKSFLSLHTQIIPVNDLSKPQEALSDHQALLTTVIFR